MLKRKSAGWDASDHPAYEGALGEPGLPPALSSLDALVS
jgi:hypothetical protein